MSHGGFSIGPGQGAGKDPDREKTESLLRALVGAVLMAAAVILLLLAVLEIWGGPAEGATPPATAKAEPAPPSVIEACLECHGDGEFKAEDGRSLAVDPAAFDAGSHGGIDCTACHKDATPEHEKLKAIELTVCSDCHDEAVTEYQRSIHGKAHAEGKAEAAVCGDCHGNIHYAKPSVEQDSPVHDSRLAQTCARCHGDTRIAEKFGIPVVRPVEAYLKSAHANFVARGKIAENGDGKKVSQGRHGATCSDCHGTHAILSNTEPGSSIWRGNVPATCGTCHEQILAEYEASVHGAALKAGNKDSPVCTDCHGEHRILAIKAPDSPVFGANLPRETCGRCHADQRLVEKYGLGGDNVSAFEDSFHGLALRSGRPQVANCASCHGFHGIRKSSDPLSSVNPNNLAATCGKCHPGAGSKFQLGPVHGEADSFGPVAVGWVRWGYLWLISLVIGGMVLHNSLDWLRKSRYPEPRPAVEEEAQERMPRPLRRQHATMMISFPLLVYSGFALKYPESWWAAPLLLWEDRISLRGWIHRISALLMTAGFLWHLVYVLTHREARACMARMLPRLHDLRAAMGTMAWYLGRRERRPFSGTFNYAEKAEYWAFLWGTTVMSITGILLWASDLSLRYLPGWVADVATALHFYEAILATLAILVWHLYWVIFDPEVYPMDWSWLTGKSPPSRVHERSRDDG